MVASDCQVDITVFVLLFCSRDWIHVIFSCNLQLDIGWLNSWIIDSFNVRVNVRALLLGSDYLYLLKKKTTKKQHKYFLFGEDFPWNPRRVWLDLCFALMNDEFLHFMRLDLFDFRRSPQFRFMTFFIHNYTFILFLVRSSQQGNSTLQHKHKNFLNVLECAQSWK